MIPEKNKIASDVIDPDKEGNMLNVKTHLENEREKNETETIEAKVKSKSERDRIPVGLDDLFF